MWRTSLLALAAVLVLLAVPARSAPSGAVYPRHVAIWLYYGAWHQNEDLPPAWVAAHADYMEADASQPDFVEKFKRAGGRYAVMYTDPSYIPYCDAPFTPGSARCDGPIGNHAPEAAFLHGPDGERVRREDSYTHKYQEAFNPAAPAARSAYRTFTEEVAKRAPDVDMFLADDSGNALRGRDGSMMSGHLYKFNAPAVEIADEARYVEGEKELLSAAVRPVIFNGGDAATLMPAYDGAFLRVPNVRGATLEGCFLASWYPRPVSEVDGTWQKDANALLAIARTGRHPVCFQQAHLAEPASRLYGLASWWLTYDEHLSVLAVVERGSDGHAPFAEDAIVPLQPHETAHSIDDLRDRSGAYVRQFGVCAQDGRPIGPCAAVVNPSANATVPVPSSLQGYRRALVVDARSAYGGGRADWSAGRPATLAPLTAAILVR